MFSVYWRVGLDVKREEREKKRMMRHCVKKITIEVDMENATAYNNASSTSNKQVSLVKRKKCKEMKGRRRRKRKEKNTRPLPKHTSINSSQKTCILLDTIV